MTKAQKKQTIAVMWRADLSDDDIASEVGATKGQVVGFRHRHLPELTGQRTRGSKPRSTKVATAKPRTSRKQASREVPHASADAAVEPAEPNLAADAPASSSGMPTDEDVTKAWEQAVVDAAGKAPVESAPAHRPSRSSVLVFTPKRQEQEVVKISRGPTCVWPLTTGNTLASPKLCGEPAEDGLCSEHRTLVGRLSGRARPK